MISTVYTQFAIMIVMASAGFIAVKTGALDKSVKSSLSDILLLVTIPCNLIASSRKEYTKEELNIILQIAIVAVLYYIIAICITYTLKKKLPYSEERKNLFSTLVVFANTAFIGFPVISVFLGDTGIFYAGIYGIFYNIFQFTYGVRVYDKKSSPNLLNIFKTPSTVASLLMLILFIFQIKLPYFFHESMSLLGGMTVPLSMLVVGIMFTEIDFKNILKQRDYYLISFFKLIVCPFVMFAAMLLFKVNHVVSVLCIVMSCMPSGTMNIILAEKYNCEPIYASEATAQSTALFFALMPLIAILIQKYFVF